MKNFTLIFVVLLSATTLISFLNDNENIDNTNTSIGPKVTLNTGSNVIGKFDLTDRNNITNTSFQSASSDVSAIKLDADSGSLIEASKSQNNVLIFENINNTSNGTALALSLSSDVKVENARDIAVVGNKIVVSSDGVGPGDSNKFYVYETTSNALKLVKVFETGHQHWGIFMIGTTLYTAVDNSGYIAIYHDFFNRPAGELTANDILFIEGVKSLRGITYDDTDDTLFLSDVVEPSNDIDGAIHTINNFSLIYSGLGSHGTIESANIKTVRGSRSMLGYPDALQYDNNIGKILYTAERADNEGMALGFDAASSSGDHTPILKENISAISSIYLNVE